MTLEMSQDKGNTLTGTDGDNEIQPTETYTSRVIKLVKTTTWNIREGPNVAGNLNPHHPTKQDIRRAGECHDYFNLVALLPLLVLILINMNFATESWQRFWWHGNYFTYLVIGSYAYFFADLFWVILVPHCVKSTATIIVHHTVTLLYMFIPIFIPEARWIHGALLSVEVNTWFLIFRRNHNTAKLEAFAEGTPLATSIRIQFVTGMFYFTWVVIRIIYYPVMLPLIFMLYLDYSKKEGYFNGLLPAPIIHCVFVYLNLKWSYDLFCPAPKPSQEEEVSRGL